MNSAHVQITGIQEEDDFTRAELDKATTNFIKKAADLDKNCVTCDDTLDIVVKKHKDSGKDDKRIKYVIHAMLQTKNGLFVAEADGFDKLITVMQDCLRKLGRELGKKHLKSKGK